MEISRKYPSIVCKYFVTKPETGAGSTQQLCRSNCEMKLLSINSFSNWRDFSIYNGAPPY